MVLIVLCVGVEFLCCLGLMCVLVFLVQSGFGGIAAHSAYDMFSSYKYLSVILVFPTRRLMEWECLSDCAIS